MNGTTLGGWLRYARLLQEAGADGVELNLYELAELTQGHHCEASPAARRLEVLRYE
jgi:dihydroorotate dehydrogenase (fumarate)